MLVLRLRKSLATPRNRFVPGRTRTVDRAALESRLRWGDDNCGRSSPLGNKAFSLDGGHWSHGSLGRPLHCGALHWRPIHNRTIASPVALMSPTVLAVPVEAAVWSAIVTVPIRSAVVPTVLTALAEILAPLAPVAVPITEMVVPPLTIVIPMTTLAVLAVLAAILVTELTAVLPLVALVLRLLLTLAAFAKRRRLLHARLRLVGPHHVRLVAAGEVVALLAEIVVGSVLELRHTVPLAHPTRSGVAALADLLIAKCQYDPVVMLGVLQVILRKHFITGRFGIAGERDVLLGNMSRSTPNLNIGAVRLESAGQRVLALAIIVIIVVALVTATAAPAILMSLPHGLPFSILMDPRSEPQLASRTATARSMASDLPARRTLPRNPSAPPTASDEQPIRACRSACHNALSRLGHIRRQSLGQMEGGAYRDRSRLSPRGSQHQHPKHLLEHCLLHDLDALRTGGYRSATASSTRTAIRCY